MVQNMNLPGNLNEQFIATDLLIGAKSAVRNYAYAITEVSTPTVQNVLKMHLNDAIAFHDQVFKYLYNKGYYKPGNIDQQIQLDMSAAQQAVAMQGDPMQMQRNPMQT